MKEKDKDITRVEGILDEIIERVSSIGEEDVGLFYGDLALRKEAVDRVRTVALRAESKFRQRAESIPSHVASAIVLKSARFLDVAEDQSAPNYSGNESFMRNTAKVESQQDRQQLFSRFLTFIQTYPQEQQRAIKLWLKGCSYGEIADTLDTEGFECTYAIAGNWVTTIVVDFKQSTRSEFPKQPSLPRSSVASFGYKRIFSDHCQPPHEGVSERLKFFLGVVLTFWAPSLLYGYVTGQGLPLYLTFCEQALGALLGVLLFKKSSNSYPSFLPKNLVPSAPPFQPRKAA